MNLFIIICVITLIIVMLLIWTSIIYNNYQKQKIKIIEAENDISNLLRNEFDILNSIGITISSNFKEAEPFKNLTELKGEKLSNFELNRKLKGYISELCKYKEKYSKIFRENEELIKFNESLEEIEEYIEGSQKYYNDSVIGYNKSIKVFPNIIVAKITRQKTKELFDELKNECKL